MLDVGEDRFKRRQVSVNVNYDGDMHLDILAQRTDVDGRPRRQRLQGRHQNDVSRRR
jgi:hypothetical protein